METEIMKVSVVIPVRNEEDTIGKCIESLLNNTYENFEIVVVDGMSVDKTVDVVQGYIEKYGDKIKIVENPRIYTPSGLNIGILKSTGDYVMIASGHARYSENYISECVDSIQNGECDVAGGVMEVTPRYNSSKAVAISEVLKNPFGIGMAKYRIGAPTKIYVDTVAYGIYKREIFENVGLFNEKLIRNQDIEFNLRLKKAGYKIMLIPQARSYYFARDNYGKLWKNNFLNGFWVTYSSKFVKKAYKMRHLIPLFFVIYLFFTISLLFISLPSILSVLILSPLALYFFFTIYSSIKISLKHHKFLLFPYALLAFLVLHISYGIGSFLGIFKIYSN
ncbi:MAG: glycosyltransferase family 2 protein [Fervidobacterium sp.]